MQNNVKGLIIFLVCLAGMAGAAFIMKAVYHDECWFCNSEEFYERGIEFACSEDSTKRQKGLSFIEKAASEGYAPAALLLSELYAKGQSKGVLPARHLNHKDILKCLADDVKPDGAVARKYLDQAAELYNAMAEDAEKVDPEFAYNLAIMYMSPPFSQHDNVSSYKAADVAKRLLGVAAKGGVVDAMLKLAADADRNGKDAEALKWYSMAAEKKPSQKLCLKLGDLYLYGKGTPVNHKEALKWYTKAQDEAKETCKDMPPEKREHMLDIPAVRIEIVKRKMKQAGGGSPITVSYVLGGDAFRYVIKVREEGAKGKGPVTVGEVIRTDKRIKAQVAPGIKLAKDAPREKDGFASMNQGMEWVLHQWAAAKFGASKQFIFKLENR